MFYWGGLRLIYLFISQFSDLVWQPARFKVRVIGFDRVTGSSGSIFFLNQNDIVLVKKTKINGLQLGKKNKNQRVATGFLTGSCWVNPPGQMDHTGFFLPLFFLQPGSVLARGPGSTRWAGPSFKTILLWPPHPLFSKSISL